MNSKKFKNWIAILDLKTCLTCRALHGKIYLADEEVKPKPPPLHFKCRCSIQWVKELYAGTATDRGTAGADWYLKWHGRLPDYYIKFNEAIDRGYIPALGNLSLVAPDKMLSKGHYANRNGHLPSAPGRIWYEADINYFWGYRGDDRVLYSNDGLIFVTYDHYKTFHLIV